MRNRQETATKSTKLKIVRSGILTIVFLLWQISISFKQTYPQRRKYETNKPHSPGASHPLRKHFARRDGRGEARNKKMFVVAKILSTVCIAISSDALYHDYSDIFNRIPPSVSERKQKQAQLKTGQELLACTGRKKRVCSRK